MSSSTHVVKDRKEYTFEEDFELPEEREYLGRSVSSFGKKCDWKAGVKAAAIAAAAAAIFVGIVGLLVYLGQLQLGLTGVGSMSQTIGLYTMLGGFGVAFVDTILLTVAICLAKAKAKSEEGIHSDKEGSKCGSLCSKGGKKTDVRELRT